MKLWDGYVLGIESSCDETAAAILSGRKVLSNIISSQAQLHEQWGGVVPEAAARAHIEAIVPVLDSALSEAGIRKEDVSAIAVTHQPGLVGALSVGVTAAKTLAIALGIPIIGVHHLEGHLISPCLGHDVQIPTPHLCLIVSGGHTELAAIRDWGDYEIVAETLDDAAGEAFDKSARLLGLGYPGGYALMIAAQSGNPKAFALPRGVAKDPEHFSFSGLKTAVRRLIESQGTSVDVADVAASVQAAIVDALVRKTEQALDDGDYRALTVAGGVAANDPLRSSLERLAKQNGIPFFAPRHEFCTDHAAMIALAGSFRLARGERSDLSLDLAPSAPLP